ncbi:hypothetical protein ACJRO7_014002 [Eucalyptus globulus]|uniref:Meiotic nuclear division protein 1 homolog n=1 Tax=Eucalyptus globulus TaxID=34317 RepID=A0ABD3L2L7_EUCGL
MLKELEKLGPRKGVITQSVKDVVQSLVDDDLVYFWSLPSCAGNKLRNVYQKLESDVQSSKRRLAELADQCNALKKGREESDEREDALSNLKKVEETYTEFPPFSLIIQNEKWKYADNDPAAFEAMKDAISVAHAAANRWTGIASLSQFRDIVNFLYSGPLNFFWGLNFAKNISTLIQWCSNNFPESITQLLNTLVAFDLFCHLQDIIRDFPNNLDYLEMSTLGN